MVVMKPLPILVVEDDVSLREAPQDTLELAGYTVLTAADGDDALVECATSVSGLILSPTRRCSQWMATRCSSVPSNSRHRCLFC